MYATGGSDNWYINRRPRGSLGMMSPAEYEDARYVTLNREPQSGVRAAENLGTSTCATNGRAAPQAAKRSGPTVSLLMPADWTFRD